MPHRSSVSPASAPAAAASGTGPRPTKYSSRIPASTTAGENPITVQPAEIVKITFILLLARQLALLQEKRDLRSFTNVIQPTAHAGAMFVFYYILSKDAGSGLVYLFVFLCMAFAAGFALRWIFLGVGGAVGAFLAAWNLGLLRGDWYDRIKVILDHSYQPEKKGFQQTRGMLALGSGRLHLADDCVCVPWNSPCPVSLPEPRASIPRVC